MVSVADSDLQTSLHLRRTFAAPRERVFRAWTEPAVLEKWFKPMGLTITVAALELSVGGEYRFKLHGPDGSDTDIAGTYLEVDPPARLVFTWVTQATRGEQTVVTVDFVERDGLTEVQLTHDRLADEAMILAHQSGWESCIDRVAEVL
jgi:uncharacterized protein YndB with AHSA1/START domain